MTKLALARNIDKKERILHVVVVKMNDNSFTPINEGETYAHEKWLSMTEQDFLNDVEILYCNLVQKMDLSLSKMSYQ